jgi:hypothetical protein
MSSRDPASDRLNERNSKSNDFTSVISAAKESVSVLRDFMLFLMALLLIAFPTIFNSILERAGFEEGNFAGLKWKSGLARSDQELKEANATITDLKKQNGNLLQALKQARPELKDAQLQNEIGKLQQSNDQLNSSVQDVQSAVSETIASNGPLVNKVLSASGGKFGVVWSGDSTLDGAKREVETVAPRFGLPHSSIFLRNGSYRSVAIVANKGEADAVLPKARDWRPDAYIVNMNTWCPNPVQKAEYSECPGT